jgi:hypothetical protein
MVILEGKSGDVLRDGKDTMIIASADRALHIQTYPVQDEEGAMRHGTLMARPWAFKGVA